MACSCSIASRGSRVACAHRLPASQSWIGNLDATLRTFAVQNQVGARCGGAVLNCNAYGAPAAHLWTTHAGLAGPGGVLLSCRYHALLTTAIWRALQSNRANANNTPRWDEGAVAGFAAHTLLTHWFPWTFSRNDLLLKDQIANVSVVEIAGARQLGEAVANRVTGARTGDGFARYRPGVWAPANETGSIGRYQQTPGQTCESSW